MQILIFNAVHKLLGKKEEIIDYPLSLIGQPDESLR